MKIISVDPSINPENFVMAFFKESKLSSYSTASDYQVSGENRLRSIYEAGWSCTIGEDILIIDYPSMTPYAKSSRGSRPMNSKALALNHQAIGAFLAGANLPDDRIIKWNSAKHKVNKEMVRRAMISKYNLPANTKDHVTDAIYRGGWLVEMLKRYDLKTIKAGEEGIKKSKVKAGTFTDVYGG